MAFSLLEDIFKTLGLQLVPDCPSLRTLGTDYDRMAHGIGLFL